jgi:hypothetical protein
MQRHYPRVPFARYADDVIVHCQSEQEAVAVLAAIRGRFTQCGLELHPTKTRIVYCQDGRRTREYDGITFDFLGYTFQPRQAKTRQGERFVGFRPAISRTAAQAIRQVIRDWRRESKTHLQLGDLAAFTNASVRGWMNYYGRFYRSACVRVLHHLNLALVRWVRRKYKRVRRRWRAAESWLARVARRDPSLFVLWQLGVRPVAERYEPDVARATRPVP